MYGNVATGKPQELRGRGELCGKVWSWPPSYVSPADSFKLKDGDQEANQEVFAPNVIRKRQMDLRNVKMAFLDVGLSVSQDVNDF